MILFYQKKYLVIADNDCEVTTVILKDRSTLITHQMCITPFNINEDYNFINISGTIYANDCISTIKNVQIDVWQYLGEFDPKTNEFINSNYETIHLRTITSDVNGNYTFLTIKPGKYLNGSYYRPSHSFQTKIWDLELTTQLYFEGDSSIQ